MKKADQWLNSIFSIAGEMVVDNGEDCFYYDTIDNDFIIAAFDGCGGSGSKKYNNYSGKTGAYVASRAVCGGVKEWFCNSREDEKIEEYIREALSICEKHADKAGRILGSLGKAFPTTAAIITVKSDKGKKEATCYWAGDSRCYMLNSEGLHQLTEDDLDGQDAMSNLQNDGVMTNVINASVPFVVHKKRFDVLGPCILMSATDGCFGYLNSPMEYEHLLTDSLMKSKSLFEWKKALHERFLNVAGDDYTLSVAICGFNSFDDVKKAFANRNGYVTDKYINSTDDVNDNWRIYKEEYSKYMVDSE